MVSNYHNHKLLTTPWHREEEPLNYHETPGRQIKQSSQQPVCGNQYGFCLTFSTHHNILVVIIF